MTLLEIERRLFTPFGGKRAWLRLVGARVAHAAGRYARLEAVEWAAVERLVFVCAGNICRSPYGEARARSAGLPATSFGLFANPGVGADPHASLIAEHRGIDLAAHRARNLTEAQLTPGDCILLFDPRHFEVLMERLPPGSSIQVGLLGLCSEPAYPYIHDPYGLDQRYFEACFARIDSAVQRVATVLRAGDRQ